MNDPIIVSTAPSAYFAELIAAKLSVREIMQVTRKPFGDGERYLKYDIDDRMAFFGKDVVVVGSTHTDDDFTEVERLGTAAAKYGARRVIYVIPFFGYSTMERAVKPGEIVTAKINARKLSQLPQGDVRNCFLMLDLHTAGIVHYFEGECLRFELYAERVLVKAIERLGLSNFMFGTADLSRVKWAKTYSRIFKTRFAIVDKSRDFETTNVDAVIGDVAGMNVIIYDDMVRSAKSLVDAAVAYLDKGAAAVYGVTSHLALNDLNSMARVIGSPLAKVVGTNSHPMSQHDIVRRSPKFGVDDVSDLFADAAWKLIRA